MPQISIRQNFRLNGEDHYTIFDVPISVTNKINTDVTRPSCDSLNNPMLTPEQINVTAANDLPVMFAPGDATVIQTAGSGSNSGDGLGPTKPSAQGLGSGAGMLSWRSGVHWLCLFSIVFAIVL
jgi:hypothetical protein